MDNINGLNNSDNKEIIINISDDVESLVSLDSSKSPKPEIYDIKLIHNPKKMDRIISTNNLKELKYQSDVIIKKFYDYRPKCTIQYFTKPKHNDIMGHAVVIPFFNEESYELQQTLNSLYDTHHKLITLSKKWKNKSLYVCLIQDGWHKASKSMKNYLKYLFPKKINGINWWDYFDELKFESHSSTNATFIIERNNYISVNINPQDKYKDEEKRMIITLVIKANNRRKHNSHEWFLAKTGFAQTIGVKYLFLTDAFTLYADKCLYYLTKDLEKNNSLSGITGRQRLMTRCQQGSGESIFSFGYILRMLQLFDFELANAVYNGAFSLGGLLPVIPGPCGLYRASDLLQDHVRESYFNVVNEEPINTGLVLGNLRIAEDRILTYYAATKTKDEKYLSFNPLALFYFEAETDLQKFILQRRRWINGSVAGYIYLLFENFHEFKQWNAPIIRKIYIWLLLLCQFIIYCMVAIVPGISLKTLYYGIEYFMSYYKFKSELALTLTFMVIWALYVLHVFVHHKNRFNYIIMYLLVILSLVTTIVSYGSLFHYAFIATNKTIIELLSNGHPVLYMAIAVLICPFISSIFLSGRGHSFMYMIKSFIQYMLFVPLLVGWFGSYAYSRTWDLSWGNRPANELNDITIDQKKMMVTKFKEKSVRIILLLILLNIAVFFIPLQGQLYLMGTFFVISLSQLLFSFIYSLSKIKYKIQMVYNHYKDSQKNINIPSNNQTSISIDSYNSNVVSI